MKALHSVAFPDADIVWAGVGQDPRLCWWTTPGTVGDASQVVTAGSRSGDDLELLGRVGSGRRVARVRFTTDGGHLLVVAGEVLHGLQVRVPNASVEIRDIGDANVTDVASHDGRVVFLARSLAWPPIWRLEADSGRIDTMTPVRVEVTKHQPLLALSPDGRSLAFGHVFDAIEVFDLVVDTSAPWPKSAATIPDRALRVSDMLAHLNFTADGKHLWSVSHPRQSDRPHILRIGDVHGREVHQHPLNNYLPIIAVAAGGRILAAARRDVRGRVEILDLVTGETRDTTEVGSRVMALALDSTGRLTVVHDGGVSVFSTEVI